MSISAYASDLSAASPSLSCEFTQSNPSPQSGMVQPAVNEMFATVHAAGSSLLGLFTSCATFDSTGGCEGWYWRLRPMDIMCLSAKKACSLQLAGLCIVVNMEYMCSI
eukprot:scaffold3627_cov124-Isochrysis_galbana.AAC.3